jgi:hypothetical protein
MIVGVTHEKDGRVKISRTVTTKIAIGLPPDEQNKYPRKLDHFVFLKKVKKGSEIGWEVDPKLQEQYGEKCTEIWIVFLDDQIDQVFRTEYAAYVKRGCWCRGDGVKAQRRDLGKNGQEWGDFKVFNDCAESKCPNLHDEGNKLPCKPSGDLYFMLADNPSLGSICRWHTSSYQSIRQVYSALQDLRRVTGGRLMGVAAKMFVHADKNSYEQAGQMKTGTKFVVGLELRAKDLEGIQTRMLETAKVFNQIKGELNGQVLEIEEDEYERGSEIAPEFYNQPATTGVVLVEEHPDLRAEAIKLMQQLKLNEAQQEMRLQKFNGKLPELIEQLKLSLQPPTQTIKFFQCDCGAGWDRPRKEGDGASSVFVASVAIRQRPRTQHHRRRSRSAD